MELIVFTTIFNFKREQKVIVPLNHYELLNTDWTIMFQTLEKNSSSSNKKNFNKFDKKT